MYALIDGNSFYASCERVYCQAYRSKPVVVLSNNDGCVITRTSEAKALGIKMGEPYFKIKDLCNQHGVVVLSSNYELYGDLSRRMMQTIATLVPQTEIYSIDECFADVAGMKELTELGTTIRQRVLQWVGIPTCVGIAPTKTLAKYCNHLAKQYPTFNGVVNWDDWSDAIRVRALKSQPVSAIWGIGRQLTLQLNTMGIDTAYDFVNASTPTLRRKFGVVVERTQRELQGIACADLKLMLPAKQQIIRSRSFGAPVCDIDGLKSAIAHHCAEAARDLRAQQSVANLVGVMVRTNPFKEAEAQYKGYLTLKLPVGTCDTLKLNRAAQWLLSKVYKAGFAYKKCGIVLIGIEPHSQQGQLDWLNPGDSDARMALMGVLDGINTRYGKGSIKTGDQDLSRDWLMRRDKLSPCYTTKISDLINVT
jgi:DNA polymerase V